MTESYQDLAQFAKSDALTTEILGICSDPASTYAQYRRARVLLGVMEGRLIGRQRRGYNATRAAHITAIQQAADWVYSQMLQLEIH